MFGHEFQAPGVVWLDLKDLETDSAEPAKNVSRYDADMKVFKERERILGEPECVSCTKDPGVWYYRCIL